MATSKVQIGFNPVATGLDIVIRDEALLVWNTDIAAFETWDDLNLADYAVAAEYVKGNMYTVQWPLIMPTGLNYMYITTLRSSASAPSLVDPYLGGGNVNWDKDTESLTLGGTGTGAGGDVLNIVHDTTQIINSQ